jgi:hypothetical protein
MPPACRRESMPSAVRRETRFLDEFSEQHILQVVSRAGTGRDLEETGFLFTGIPDAGQSLVLGRQMLETLGG